MWKIIHDGKFELISDWYIEYKKWNGWQILHKWDIIHSLGCKIKILKLRWNKWKEVTDNLDEYESFSWSLRKLKDNYLIRSDKELQPLFDKLTEILNTNISYYCNECETQWYTDMFYTEISPEWYVYKTCPNCWNKELQEINN